MFFLFSLTVFFLVLSFFFLYFSITLFLSPTHINGELIFTCNFTDWSNCNRIKSWNRVKPLPVITLCWANLISVDLQLCSVCYALVNSQPINRPTNQPTNQLAATVTTFAFACTGQFVGTLSTTYLWAIYFNYITP